MCTQYALTGRKLNPRPSPISTPPPTCMEKELALLETDVSPGKTELKAWAPPNSVRQTRACVLPKLVMRQQVEVIPGAGHDGVFVQAHAVRDV